MSFKNLIKTKRKVGIFKRHLFMFIDLARRGLLIAYSEERFGHSKSVLKTSPNYSENIVQNRYAIFLHISFIMLIFR